MRVIISSIILCWILIIGLLAREVHAEGNPAITDNSVIITEINWAGSAFGSEDEWIEIFNNSDENVDLTSYLVRGIAKRDITLQGIIGPKQYFLIANNDPARGKSALQVAPDLITNISIPNNGFHISLIQIQGGNEIVVDEVDTAGKPPFAGTNSTSGVFARASMERIDPEVLGMMSSNWKTAEFSVNIRPKTFETTKILDLGSPKAPTQNQTVLRVADLMNGQVSQTQDTSTVPILQENPTINQDSSQNSSNLEYNDLFKLKTNFSNNRRYSITISNNSNVTKYGTTVLLQIKQKNTFEEKQFLKPSNSFIYLSDTQKGAEISLSLDRQSSVEFNYFTISYQDFYEESVVLDAQNSYSEGEIANGTFKLNHQGNQSSVLISKSLNNLKHPTENRQLLMQAQISLSNTPVDTNFPILSLSLSDDQNTQNIVENFTMDDLENGNLSISVSFTLEKEGNSWVKIETLANAEYSLMSAQIIPFDAERYQEQINLNKFAERKDSIKRIPGGIKIPETSFKKVKFANISMCNGKSKCQISFEIKNPSNKPKLIRVAFGFKNESYTDYQTEYVELNQMKPFTYLISNPSKTSSKIQIILSGEINDLEISDLRSNSSADIEPYKIIGKVPGSLSYSNTLIKSNGFIGQINDFVESSKIDPGRYQICFDVDSNSKFLTSNFSVLRILSYSKSGKTLINQNITEKELGQILSQGKSLCQNFELSEKSKVITQIRYFGPHKKAKSDVTLSNFRLAKIP